MPKMRNWVFVKVETDETGLYGWGEASLEWKTRSVVGAVDDFAPMLIGENPENIEFLYQKMYRQSFWRNGHYRPCPLSPASSKPYGTFAARR